LESKKVKKVEEKQPWENVSDEERRMHQSWCHKNEIYIYFEPIDWRSGRIVVIKYGEYIQLTNVYNQVKLRTTDIKYWNVIWKLYSKYYYENI